jgi:predicted nuclease of predicted toxin-antitoxin system
MGVSFTTLEALWAENHDAVHLRDEGLIRLPDSEIAAKAVAETSVVLTFDLAKFSAWRAARLRASSSFGLRNQTPAAVNPRLFRVIAECGAELASGAIVLVEDEGFRVRRLPIQP